MGAPKGQAGIFLAWFSHCLTMLPLLTRESFSNHPDFRVVVTSYCRDLRGLSGATLENFPGVFRGRCFIFVSMSTHQQAFEGRPLDRPSEDIEDQGLAFDIGTLLSRRRMLVGIGIGAGSAALVACGVKGEGASASATSSSAATTTSAAAPNDLSGQVLEEMNSETAGPYPGDGSNGPDVLDESGVERRDLTTSVDGNGSVSGVPMTLTMNLVDINNDNQPLSKAAVYVWHCDAEGRYSMYSDGVTDQTWLRGVQVTDANGQVTFDSIIPGCYTGRWPHIHFEVFTSIDDITDATNAVLTSQIVVPEDTVTEPYKLSEYDGSANNLSQITLDIDNVFSDGWEQQTPDVVGNATDGFSLAITVPVDPTTKSRASGMGGGGMSGGMPGGNPPQGGMAPPSQ